MPHPDPETLRKTIENEIHNILHIQNGCIAVSEDGEEFEFSPSGEFEMQTCLDDAELDALPDEPAEKMWTFRVRVELVENTENEQDK